MEKRENVWWLIDPHGQPFLSIGICMVNHGAAPEEWDRNNPSYSARRLYPSIKAWEDDTIARLRRWGFNTIGAWGDEALVKREELPFTVSLELGESAGFPYVDMWDPEVEKSVRELASELTAPWRKSRLLVGYFTDNEMDWWDEMLFAYHLGRPWRAQVRRAGRDEWVVNQTKLRLVEILTREYQGSLDRLKEDWEIPASAELPEDAPGRQGTTRQAQRIEAFSDLRGPVSLKRRLGRRPAVIDRFMTALYERYAEMIGGAIRSVDPNHLLLGERYHQYYTPDQVRIGGRWSDVISANHAATVDDGWISPNHLTALARLSGRPVMVTEYYFAARENATGNRNTRGEFPLVQSQAERARSYAAQVRQMAGMPYMVGWHWFQYFDQLPQTNSSFDEDYNMGLVDILNREYPDMARASRDVNGESYAVHAAARPLPEREAGTVPMFNVPPAPAPPVLDGDLRDWNKPATWLPQLGGRPYQVPFGDVFVSATPGALHVALQYQYPYRNADLAASRAPGEPWPEEETERLTIALAAADGTPVRTITWTMPPDEGQWKLLRDTGGPAPVRWSAQGVQWNVAGFEATVPAPAAQELRLAILLRSRGDAQIVYWGQYPLHERVDPAGWGRLILPAR